MKEKQLYEAREGAPFNSEDAQEIGEFISRCKNKTTAGILDKIKENPEHTISKYIEWDDTIAAENHRLQTVRNIVNHIEVTIVKLDGKPKELEVAISAFKSISVNGKREYVPINDVFKNQDWKSQIMSQAKRELENWSERYRQYQILSRQVKKIKAIAADLLAS